MHPLPVLAAAHAAKAPPVHLATAVTALIVAAVIVILFKITVRILKPKKTAQSPSSPYAATRK
jgi:hypothetical protein